MIDRFHIMSDPKYKDLQDMKDDLILVGLSGSHSYGTNIESSDIDIRGVRFNSVDTVLGLKQPGQYISPDTDTTIYDLNKAIPLWAQCNPNMLEILGLNEEDKIYWNIDGATLESCADMFLSKDAVKNAFGGYARSQLKRLQNGERNDGHSIKKTDAALCKHAMHVVRLLLMGIEILQTGKINTRRSDSELEFLMEIRNGEYLKNGKMVSEFYTLTNVLDGSLNTAYESSKLPDKPDWDKINKLLYIINYETARKYKEETYAQV